MMGMRWIVENNEQVRDVFSLLVDPGDVVIWKGAHGVTTFELEGFEDSNHKIISQRVVALGEE